MGIRQFAIGAAAVAVVFVVLASPQVHAVSAALVNVMNTSANPVPTRATDITNAFATRLFPTSTNPASFVVPAGRFLVITDVNGFSFGGNASDVELQAVVAGAYAGTRFPFTRPNASINGYTLNPNTHMVAAPGTTVYLVLNGTDNGGYNIDVKGYYLPAN